MELSAVFVRNYFPGCQGNFRKSFKRPWNKFGQTKSPGSPFDPNGPDSPFEPWKRDRHISIWKRYFCELNLSIVFRISIKDFPKSKNRFYQDRRLCIRQYKFKNINERCPRSGLRQTVETKHKTFLTDPEDWISFIRFSYNNSKYREKAPQDLQRYLFACISF